MRHHALGRTGVAGGTTAFHRWLLRHAAPSDGGWLCGKGDGCWWGLDNVGIQQTGGNAVRASL